MQKRLIENRESLVGKVYGRLTLTGRSTMRSAYGQLRSWVEADCICGEVDWYLLKRLKDGETRSCGCLRADVARDKMTTHGLRDHPLYDVYYSMLARCYHEKNKQYKDYGGRGITVCDDWQEGFLNFYNWAIANGYEEGKSIDREKNDGNYEPSNCRFVTRKVQSRNNRRNKMITAFGETKCLFDWGKDPRCKIGVWGLRSRYDRGEYTDMEEMITTPQVSKKESQRKMKSNKLITAFGETKTQSEWLEDKRCVVKVDGLRDRLKNGWDPERALTVMPQPSKNKKLVIESAQLEHES